jgi:putative flippase GtrA
MFSAQIVRFVAVGLINTVVGYSLYALFIYIGFGYVYALGIATVLGVLFNFQTIGRVVFESHDARLLFKFIAAYAMVFFVNLVLIKYLVIFGLSAYVAGAVALLPATVLSFVLNKYFVFKR